MTETTYHNRVLRVYDKSCDGTFDLEVEFEGMLEFEDYCDDAEMGLAQMKEFVDNSRNSTSPECEVDWEAKREYDSRMQLSMIYGEQYHPVYD